MQKVAEELQFRIARYPQLKKLPVGTKLVKQDGHDWGKGISKYAAFLKSGRCFLTSAGNSIRKARKNALNELNDQLRMVNLVYGNRARMRQYRTVLM